MTKARDLLLAGSMLPLLALTQAAPLAADPGFVVAQQAAPEDAQKGKQAPKKDQPAPKGEPASKQPPAAKGQPPSGQPPAAKQQPPSGQPAPKSAQPPAQTTPPAPKSAQPPAQTTPPAPKSAQPPARTTPPAPKSAQPPAQTTPPASKSAQPPAQGTPPAGTPAARTPPPAGQDQPPAARRQPPGQPPATQTQTAPAGQTPPPAAQQPTETQPPAARRTPGAPPAAQGAPGQTPQQQPAARTQPAGQPPAAQGQTPAPGQAPPAAQGQTPPPAQGQPTAAGQPAPFAKRQPGTPIGAQPTGSQGQPLRRVEELRQERREERQGDNLVIREGDRTIVRMGDRTIIRHSETDRFRHSGRELAVERRGGEVRTVVERPDGTRIITVTDESGRLLRRARRTREGREIIIIDNRVVARPGARADFYVQLPPPVIRIPRERYIVEADRASREDIYETLIAPPVDRIERRYSLDEVRYSPALRQRMPRIDLDSITFESGSWEIAPDQIDALAVIAEGIKRALARNPNEVFMIEGHTDKVGADVDNLSLSDRRAESVALALSEQFEVPAENLTTQGYGEQNPKVPTEGAERQNRRVTVLRITPLLTGQAGGPPRAN